MVFSSVIFIFFFLPLTLATYYCVRSDRWRNLVLLLFSLLFYFWGEYGFVLVMIGSIILGWGFGLLIDRAERYRKAYLVSGLVSTLAVLIFFKYANFLVLNWNSATEILHLPLRISLQPVHLPIGVSFFTFQILSYLIDVYRRDVKAQRSLLKMGVYKSFFPQLIAGPIVRYRDISSQMSHREVRMEDLSYGVRRFVWGLAHKVLVADVLGAIADKMFALPPGQLTMVLAWVGATAYFFQIYFDFCGYSHMAIGLARLFGFRFLENFNYPYISRSITDFWRRWHISLSSWFRDYLYIPLGGNRCSKRRNYFNLILVFFLCGLWHGASWTFAIWGLYHGVLLIYERAFGLKHRSKLPFLVQILISNFLVLIGWVIFRSDSFSQTAYFLKALIGLGHGSAAYVPLESFFNAKILVAYVLAVAFSAPTKFEKLILNDNQSGELEKRFQFGIPVLIFTLLIVCVSFVARNTYNPFIYYRF